MASGDTGIDPRYAPEFQRGFEPRSPMGSHSARAPIAGAPLRLSTGPAATADRVPPPPRLVERTPPPALGRDDVDDAPRDVAPSRSEWALLATGLVVLLVSVWLVWHNATDIDSYTSNESSLLDYAWRDARWALPGPLFVAGFVAIAAWIVVRAVREADRA
jgi:hypothetical protein